ncbi:hypothetical protein DFQ09_10185 [Winogradskyella pacifica]|uniref:Uncharacterized protein n=1 Tax=Winogradskyella pacifica TaxID=664642 RepID=A0A3D9N2Y4_9FLAO|nr:hypothetical protein [Winogradskyella pacifica]REE27257.1 hypothetical protein DFQ09_10185 [Winogradskyella pacifica]
MMNYFEEEHELDIVEDLFEYLDLDEPTSDQMYTLYGVFKKDMIEEPIYINGIQVAYDKRKSRHPLFRGRPSGFEHVCTRESKHSGKRNFDPERANKIHWIKPVVNCKEDTRVRYFERIHANGKNQQYYWLYEKDYVVIIREITNSLQLVTAFKVDDIERRRFQNWHNEYPN